MGQSQPPQQQGGQDVATTIRTTALQVLSPPEIQILEQAITPQFIQIMAKLYGDQAVILLGPLASLSQQQGGQSFTPPGQGSPLSQFSTQGSPDQSYQPPQMMGNLGMGSGGGMSNQGVCPGCNDPNCPDCQSIQKSPTSVQFGRQG
jgi:hypothetical protein